MMVLVAAGGCKEATDLPVDPIDAAVDQGPAPDVYVPPDAAADAAPPMPDLAPDPDAAPDMAIEPDLGPDPDEGPPPDMGPPACSPALAVTASPPAARPFDLVTLRARGGTGAWRYDFIDNASGALLNERTGAYLAGELIGAVDRVRLTDEGCAGEAVIDIDVVAPMDVQPQGVTLQTGSGFTFAVDGGSGDFAFAMVNDFSNGDVTPDGAYTAGDLAAQDIVRVTDRGTNEIVDVVVRVTTEPVELVPRPRRLYLPVGASAPLVVNGGSGAFEVVGAGDVIGYDAGVISARAPGRVTLDVTDRFLGLETTVRIDVVESLTADMPPFNVTDAVERVIAPGDLDGDGRPDLIVANPHANDGAGRGGAVHVFHAGDDGFGEPVQVIAAAQRNDFVGHDAAIGDVDGDGLTDLIIGARLLDIGVTDNGAILVHLGQPGGLFTEEPAYVLAAPRGSDQLGYAVGVCDFNGDGRLDIAGAATQYEDVTADPRANTQGGILVWLGYEDGFLEQPDSVVVGQRLLDDGRFEGDANQQLGWTIGVGDIDGDGYCDLVTGSQVYRDQNGGRDQANAGAAFVFRGLPPDDLGPGGLQAQPAMVIVNDRADGRLARKLVVDDFDQDGLDDILVGAYTDDPVPGNNGVDAGAAFIFRGRPLPAAGALDVTGLAAADWTVNGNSRSDQLGFAVANGDVTGDGIPDAVVSVWLEDFPGLGDAGAIHIYPGAVGALPSTTPIVLAVNEGNALLGQEVVVLGDVDGDGIGDIAAHAERSDVVNRDVGDVFVFAGGLPPEPVEGQPPPLFREPMSRVPVPVPNGNAWFGRAVGLVGDIDGDGYGDAAVGAPFGMSTGNGMRSGVGWLYRGGEAGVERAPATEIGTWPGHDAFDFGFQAVSRAGDVDGDGLADWMVLIRDDERLALNNPTLWVPDECKDGNADVYRHRGVVDGPLASRNNSGGVWIFRGRDDGTISTAPSFVFWPDMVGGQAEAFAAGDIDGDGRSDILVGAFRYDGFDQGDAGGVEIAAGRPASEDGRVRVLCDRLVKFHGVVAADQLGRSVAALGDLTGDGCAEWAIGAINHDDGFTNQGGVWVGSGFGPGCASTEPHLVAMTASLANEQAGYALAGGDLDGDALPELAVGILSHRVDNQARGGAWVVPGAWLRDRLNAAPALAPPQNGALLGPYDTTMGARAPLNPRGADGLVEGAVNGERFGTAVAIVDGKLAVAGPLGADTGVPLVGVVRIYTATAQRIRPEPWAVFIGETWRPEDRAGEDIAAGFIGDRPMLIIGAYQGQGTGRDNGSAWVLPLD